MDNRAWLFVFAALTPLSGQDALTVDDAVRRALAAHPALTAQSERIAAAGGLVQQAGLRPNPRIYLQSENWSISGADPISASVNSDQFGYFTQPMEVGGKRQRRVEWSKETLRLITQERELLEKQISSRVKQAYWAAAAELEAERARINVLQEMGELSIRPIELATVLEMPAVSPGPVSRPENPPSAAPSHAMPNHSQSRMFNEYSHT